MYTSYFKPSLFFIFADHSLIGDTVDSIFQEHHYAWLKRFLGVTSTQRISNFKYRDRDQIQKITGIAANAHAVAEKWALHTIWPVNDHECVHILVINNFGRCPLLFSEGIAVACQDSVNPRWGDAETGIIYPVRQFAGKLIDLIDSLKNMDNFIENQRFLDVNPNYSYPIAGSLTRFVIDTCGLSKMEEYISIATKSDSRQETLTKFKNVFQIELYGVWQQWIGFLEKM
jgi:hypothetical protein